MASEQGVESVGSSARRPGKQKRKMRKSERAKKEIESFGCWGEIDRRVAWAATPTAGHSTRSIDRSMTPFILDKD